MSAQDMFGIVAILYCVANLASMGLELNLSETMKALRSPRLVTLTLVWSWILAPTVPLITWMLLSRYFAFRADKLAVKA